MSRQEEAERNSETIRSEIAALHDRHWEPFWTKRDYAGFWSHVREINAFFKELWLPHSVRDELWQEFSEYVGSVKAEQEAEREERERRSAESRGVIEEAMYSARAHFDAASTKDDFLEAKDRVREIVDLFKERFLLGNDRAELWEEYRELQERVHYRWEELSDFFEGQVDHAIGEAMTALSADLPYDALQHVKEAQQLIRESLLSKPYRDHARSQLQETWDSAVGRIEDMKEERRQRHEEWQRDMEGHIDRWQERIDHLEEVIERIEGQIDDCEEMRADAKTDDFAAEVEGWIREKEDKIADIRETIRELEGKISSVEQKLRESDR